MIDKVLHLHLVSDSSGETVTKVSQAAVIQFTGLHIIEYAWPMVRTKEQIDNLKKSLLTNAGIVIHTMVNNEIRDYLISECKAIGIRCICPIESVLHEVEEYLNIHPSKHTPGKHGDLYDLNLKKMESIDFTINHDDGAIIEECDKADVTILGVSRTSKSPTAFYLAQRTGYKISNIPIVMGIDIESHIQKCTNTTMIGLTINPKHLYDIRSKRFASYADEKSRGIFDNYLSLDYIVKEVKYAENIFIKYKISMVDVTAKAVEEIAGEIINILFMKSGGNKILEFKT